MPEYPLCIDVYEDKIHVAVYKTKFSNDFHQFHSWLDACKLVLQRFFNVEEDAIFIKERKRMGQHVQYEKLNKQSQFFEVKENGIKFLINLQDYLDTGLFLDHRNTRNLVKSQSKGKQVLNLFAYTGSFSVYAAMGGAFSTTTVDLSNTYLNWAKENFKLNQLSISKHQFIKADVKEWIAQQPTKLYDLIVLDPPTISKSKMTKSDFDVQLDHVELINNTLNHLKEGGLLYFSNNYRSFQLDADKIKASTIDDISQASVPFDFRNKKIHTCWKLIK
ncbi:MAG: class I SAM-dependent methyltransferase [Chitinophagaceae bacterium]|nr:class I SAM-dependent methyltransferase [Chitinophagaceae bacterium]